MDLLHYCPVCGRKLPDNRLDGFCPACAWKSLSEDLDVPQAAPRWSTGSLLRVPGHELTGEIARGGMGIVYRAEQLDPRRTVALKMLLPHQLGAAGVAERFRLEVRALTELEHPAILPVFQAGEHQGLPFFTMKLATGGTLAQRKQKYIGDWRAIADLLARLADAVQFAHDHGVLHRDLKPGNILFDDQARPYVSDFGLAKLISEDSDLTQSSYFLGTPHYIAPEVAAKSAREATTASDVYSLGAILYELLAGHPPFEAEGVPALLKKIAEEEPAKFSNQRTQAPSKERTDSANTNSNAPTTPVPRDLEVICFKCLNKDPARRYAAPRELALDLRRWLEGLPILARPVSPAENLWRWAVRNPMLATISALLALTLLSGGLALGRANFRLKQAVTRAEIARAEALANLHAELLSQARAQRGNGYGTNAAATLNLLTRAAQLGPTLETRNEAVAALAEGAGTEPVLRELATGLSRPQFPCTFDISADDSLLLIGTIDSVQLVDAHSGRELWTTLISSFPWNYVGFHPDGQSLLYSSKGTGIIRREFRCQRNSDGAVEVKVGEGTLIGPDHDSTLQSIQADGKTWVVALDRDPLYIIRMDVWPDGQPERARTIASGERMTALALSPDGHWAASTTLPGTDVRLWNAISGQNIGMLGAEGATLRQFTPDGRWLVVRTTGEFRLWEVGTWKQGSAWPVPPGSHAMARISFSPDGSVLALPQTTQQFQLVSLQTLAELATLPAPKQIHDAVWSHDGQRLYLLAVDNHVFEWDFPALHRQLSSLSLDW
jgi:hypothetical protein